MRYDELATEPHWTDPTASGPGVLRRSLRPDDPTVSVIVPTLNEARNLPFALARLPECVTEVIIVDGHSTDDTTEIAQHLRCDVRIVKEPRKGKGIALQRGFDEATGDIVVMLDADGSADPAEIRLFVDALVGGADFAKGSRFLPCGGSIDLTPIRSLGNRALTGAVNLVCQTRYTDLCYGYNAFWRDCLEFVPVDVTGFEVETRLNMSVAVSGLAVVEVPSHEFCRVHGTSNLHAIRDGLRVLRTIITSSRELRKGRQSVRCDAPIAPHVNRSDHKSLFVLAGDAPAWVFDQTVHAAEQMTADGRVLVAMTDGRSPAVHLPGSVGGSTLLGISPAGFPLWTARLRTAFGIRRKITTTTVVNFDGARSVPMLAAAVSGRLRKESVIVQDLRSPAGTASLRTRATAALLRRFATKTVGPDRPVEPSGRCDALAEVGDDMAYARLLVDSTASMAQDVARGWKLTLFSDDQDVRDMVLHETNPSLVEVRSGKLIDDEIAGADVVLVRHRVDKDIADDAGTHGVHTVVVGHPTASRVSHSFHGEWLARRDPASVLVALECAGGLRAEDEPSGPRREAGRGRTGRRASLPRTGVTAPLSVGVVICAYTERRWDLLIRAVDSARGDPRSDAVILVIDHHHELFDRCRGRWNDIAVIENAHERGLSGARNTGVEFSSTDVIAFLDDDAVATPGWLDALTVPFDDATVGLAAGRVVPEWALGEPDWFPPEFLWVVGSSYDRAADRGV